MNTDHTIPDADVKQKQASVRRVSRAMRENLRKALPTAIMAFFNNQDGTYASFMAAENQDMCNMLYSQMMRDNSFALMMQTTVALYQQEQERQIRTGERHAAN